MANPLLDFVMSLVRDPDAAAQLCRRPGQGHPGRQSYRCDQRRRERADSRRVGVAVDGDAGHRRGGPRSMIRPATCGAAGRRPSRSTHSATKSRSRSIDDGHSVASNVIEQPQIAARGSRRLDDAGVPDGGGCRGPVDAVHRRNHRRCAVGRRGHRHRLAVRRRRRAAPAGHRRFRLRHLRLARSTTSRTARPAMVAPFSCVSRPC